MPLEIPSREVVSYLARFGVACVFVAGAADGMPPAAAGSAVDIGRALAVLTRRRPQAWDGPPVLHYAAWAERRAAARIAELAVQHELRAMHMGGGLLRVNAALARDAVERMAKRAGVALADHAATLARAKQNVDRIAARVEASRENGALAEFNRLYRERRLAAQKAGARMMPYGVALARLRAVMAEAAATGGAASTVAIFARVFGD
jgi:hypothetical protein